MWDFRPKLKRPLNAEPTLQDELSYKEYHLAMILVWIWFTSLLAACIKYGHTIAIHPPDHWPRPLPEQLLKKVFP